MPTDNGEHLFFIYDMHGLQAEEEEEKEEAGGVRVWERMSTKMRLSVLLIPGDGSWVVHCKTNYFSKLEGEISVK